MKRVLLILMAIAVLLTACQSAPVVVMAEPEEEEYTYAAEGYELEPPPAPRPEPEPPPPSLIREDFIEMLYALQHAFATGEFEAFIEAYPGWAEEGRGMPGAAVNEWPALLEGVAAVMIFDEEDVDFDLDAWIAAARVTVRLYVSGGNRHLPNGEQTLEFSLVHNRDTNAPSIYRMILNTDGRGWWPFSEGWPENRTFEDRVLDVTRLMMSNVAGSGLAIDKTMGFLRAFESDELTGEIPFTEEQMIEGARRFLGIEDFLPADYRFNSEEDNETLGRAREEGRSTAVWYEGGVYLTPGMGFYAPPLSVLILPTPSQGDMTVRVFVHANDFDFEVREIIDFNYQRLYDDDGTPYARLLSEQLREDLL